MEKQTGENAELKQASFKPGNALAEVDRNKDVDTTDMEQDEDEDAKNSNIADFEEGAEESEDLEELDEETEDEAIDAE